MSAGAGHIPLNEGGGLHPRNALLPTVPLTAQERSMKAGAFTPATPDVAGQRLRDRQRSMKAGAFTPATPPVVGDADTVPPSLNEGGGLHPRNALERRFMAVAGHRSMKAGAFTPATRPKRSGYRPPAPHRSMKAGAFTPATRGPIVYEHHICPRPLNEGGGLHPRNAGRRSR